MLLVFSDMLDDMLVHLAVHMLIFIPIYNLVGGFNPSEKYESQLGWLFPHIWENKTCSKPPTGNWQWNVAYIFWNDDSILSMFSLIVSHVASLLKWDSRYRQSHVIVDATYICRMDIRLNNRGIKKGAIFGSTFRRGNLWQRINYLSLNGELVNGGTSE